MCLAVPGKLIERRGNEGLLDVRGNRVRARLDVVPEAKIGDYVLLHAGLVITVISPEDAAETEAVFDELDELKRADGRGV